MKKIIIFLMACLLLNTYTSMFNGIAPLYTEINLIDPDETDLEPLESKRIMDNQNNKIFIEKYEYNEITIFLIETPEAIHEIYFNKNISLDDFIKAILQGDQFFNEYGLDTLVSTIDGYIKYQWINKEIE